MSEDFFDSEDDSFNEERERPAFLTVLIILTWISVAYTVTTNAYSMVNSGNTADQVEESMKAFDQIPNDNPMMTSYINDVKDFTLVSIQNIKAINLSNLVLYLIEGFAALLMFNLKKIGLWLYILSQFGAIFTLYSFYPSNNIMTNIMLTLTIIFSLLFSILYGVNAKHLKN